MILPPYGECSQAPYMCLLALPKSLDVRFKVRKKRLDLLDPVLPRSVARRQDGVRVRDDVGDAGALLCHRPPLEALHRQEVPTPGHNSLRIRLQHSKGEERECITNIQCCHFSRVEIFSN